MHVTQMLAVHTTQMVLAVRVTQMVHASCRADRAGDTRYAMCISCWTRVHTSLGSYRLSWDSACRANDARSSACRAGYDARSQCISC